MSVSRVNIVSASATRRAGVTVIFTVLGDAVVLNQLSTQMTDTSASGFATIFLITTANAGIPIEKPSVTVTIVAPTSSGCNSSDPLYDFFIQMPSDSGLSWKLYDSKVAFKLTQRSSSAGWLSLAVSSDGLMVGGDAVVGQLSGVSKYDLNGKSVSSVVVQSSSRQDLTNDAYSYIGGVRSLTFTRPYAANGGKAIAASGVNIFLWAYGTGTFGYHTGAGSVSLDLTSCKSEIISADNSKFTAHGWLMALGWGVVIPLGTVFASATRGDRSVLRINNWHHIHMGIQLVGVVAFTIGLVLAIVATNDMNQDHWQSTHAIVGLLVCILGWVQMLFAVVRPANDPEKESFIHKLWSWKHRILGVGLMVLSVVNIFSGMAKHDVATISRWLFVAWLILIAGAFIGVHSYKVSIAQDPEPEPYETITPMQSKDRIGNKRATQAFQFQATVGSLPPLQTPSAWCES